MGEAGRPSSFNWPGLARVASMLRGNRGLAATAQVMALRSIALGVNLCTGLLTAAVLGAEGRGIQAALITGPQFLAATSTLGLHAALIYNIKADPEHEGAYLGCTLLLGLASGLLASAIGWALAPVWLSHYSPHLIMVSRLLMLIAPVSLAGLLLGATLEAHGRFGLANQSLYIASLCTLTGLLGLWLAGALTPVAAACAYLLPQIAVLAYMIICVRRLARPVFTLAPRFVRPSLHYAIRFYGCDLLGHVATYLDQIVIVLFLAPREVGIYAVALSLARILSVLQGAVSTVLFPSIAARHPDSVLETVGVTVRVMIVVNALAAIALGIVGPFLLRALYGPSFAEASLVFRVLLLDSIVANAARILYNIFTGTGRPGVVTVFEATGVAVSFTAMMLLVPQFGIMGAAFSILIASVARLASVLLGLRAVLRVEMPRLILGRADLRWVIGA